MVVGHSWNYVHAQITLYGSNKSQNENSIILAHMWSDFYREVPKSTQLLCLQSRCIPCAYKRFVHSFWYLCVNFCDLQFAFDFGCCIRRTMENSLELAATHLWCDDDFFQSTKPWYQLPNSKQVWKALKKSTSLQNTEIYVFQQKFMF